MSRQRAAVVADVAPPVAVTRVTPALVAVARDALVWRTCAHGVCGQGLVGQVGERRFPDVCGRVGRVVGAGLRSAQCGLAVRVGPVRVVGQL